VVFDGGGKCAEDLEPVFEVEAAKRFAISPTFVVRTAAEWRRLVADNPFVDEARDDPGHLCAFALKSPPDQAALERLIANLKGPDKVVGGSCHLYIFYAAGIGISRLTNTVIERALGTRGTARNWNTVLKLLDAAVP
jgi:uncharacterized protein (DUF1697 family)